MHNDPNWPTAALWIAGGRRGSAKGGLGLIGVPIGRGSVTPGRCDLAPAAIRRAFARFSTFDLETGADLRDIAVQDFGDLDVAEDTPAEAGATITRAVGNAAAATDAVIILGGNNSITRPACRGLGLPLSRCALLTLDAHFDLRDLDDGPGNGNPVRGLLADGLPGSHIVQIGIQSFANSPAYARVAAEAGIQVVGIDEVRSKGAGRIVSGALARLSELADRIYVDLDIDVLDRCFAPAAPGSRPGGMQPHDILEAARCCGVHPRVAAIDVVEIDPNRDVADVTILAAAASVLSFAAGYRTRPAT
jgi:formiminoglutamase